MFPMFSILNLMMYFLNLIRSTKYSLETYPFRKVGTIGNTPVSYSNQSSQHSRTRILHGILQLLSREGTRLTSVKGRETPQASTRLGYQGRILTKTIHGRETLTRGARVAF